MNIGKTIRTLRKERGLSQEKFGEQCKLSQTSLSQIENGSTQPSKSSLARICDVLNVPEFLIYLLSVEVEDVPSEKREAYEELFPVAKSLMIKLFYSDEELIK